MKSKLNLFQIVSPSIYIRVDSDLIKLKYGFKYSNKLGVYNTLMFFF